MYDKIEKYISSMIPASISDKQWSLIHDELACHIYDRIDFFIEIGYDEEASINKAIEEFGASEEITQQIASQFEELYRERTWVAVLMGVGTLVINLLTIVCGMWVASIVDGHQPIRNIEFTFGFALVFIMLMTTAIAYKKGFSLTLLGVGASNILIGFSIFGCVYPQTTFYAVWHNLCYLIDRYTSIITLGAMEHSESIALGVSIAFCWALGAINIYLANKIGKNGLPKNRSYRTIAFFAVMFIIVTAGSIQIHDISEDYFYKYNQWVNLYNSSLYDLDNDIINSFDDKTDFEKAEEILISNGYICTQNYEAGLDKNAAKRFRYNLKEMDFDLEEDYTVYFKPIENYKPSYDEYGKPFSQPKAFIYLLKGDDGKVKSKGVGCASDIPRNIYSVDCYESNKDYNAIKCLNDFKSLHVGEAKKEILHRIGTPEGDVYTKFITYTDKGVNEYYRIYCKGDAEYENERNEFYIQINFESSKLTDGLLYLKNNAYGTVETSTLVS